MDQATLRSTFLFAAANALCEKAPNLSRSLGRTLIKTAPRRSLRHRLCGKCGSVSIPGVNISMKSQGGKLKRTCVACGNSSTDKG